MSDKFVNIVAGIVCAFSLIVAYQAFSFADSVDSHVISVLSAPPVWK